MPTLLDWRDHEAVRLLVSCCPYTPCVRCAEPIGLRTPVLVLRPGDPLRCLLSMPSSSPTASELVEARALVTKAEQLGADIDTVIQVSHGDLVDLVGRYSGFALSGVAHDGAPVETSDPDWIGPLRSQIAAPDLTEVLMDLFEAEDDDAVEQVYEAHPEILDPVWAPVLSRLRARVLDTLREPDALQLASIRMTEMSRRRWPRDPVPRGSLGTLDADSRAVVEQAAGQRSDDPDNRVVLDHMVRLIDEDAEHRPFLVETLLHFAVRLHGQPDLTPVDREVVVAAGETLVPLARQIFGPDHPLTLIASNNLGAALLDRQKGDGHADRERAMELLIGAAWGAAEASDRILADILQNLAAAYAHHQDGGRAANQILAERFCGWSSHLVHALTPEDPRSALQARLTLASILRERRIGDRLAATREALEIYRDVLPDPEQVRVLRPAELVFAQSNFASALHQLRQLDPDAVNRADVLAVTMAVAAAAENLPNGDPMRIQVLSNSGGILGELYHDNGFGDRALLARAIELTGQAHDEAKAVHQADHPEALRLGLNHAAMLGMPVRAETDSDEPSAAVRTYDAERARALLTELIATCPIDRLPAHAVIIAHDLGRSYCAGGEWAAACGAFTTAITAMERLYRDCSDPETQLAELGAPTELSSSSLSGWLVSASIEAKDPAGALASIEQSRNRLLADKLRLTGTELEPGLGDDAGPVLYVGVSALGSWVILVPSRGPAKITTSQTNAGDIRAAVLRLRFAEEPAERGDALDDIAELLRSGIIDPAYDLLADQALTEIEIVASGLLSGLPLHALPASRTGGCWLDLATVRYLPSATIARVLRSRTARTRGRHLAVADPRLWSARHEATLLAAIGVKVDVATEADGRRRWLLEHLREAAHLLLSCHARWLPNDPLRSPIELDEDNVVLLADLLSVANVNLGLVVASCCETGVPNESLADEVLGFGTGFLFAGSQAAIVSNWRLGDLTSALTLAAFFQEIRSGREAAAALRTAQRWLAQLTVADRIALGEGRPAKGRQLDLPEDLAVELQAIRHTDLVDQPQKRLYEHPAAWGGLSYYGIPLRYFKDEREWGFPAPSAN